MNITKFAELVQHEIDWGHFPIREEGVLGNQIADILIEENILTTEFGYLVFTEDGAELSVSEVASVLNKNGVIIA